jgi:hydrogenase maturation protease
MSPRISMLIAGVGNIFLGDDAFGVEVIRRLRGRAELGRAEIVDFGIRSMDLAYALARSDAAIIVDLVSRGGSPGTVYVLEVDPGQAMGLVDAHAMTPHRVIAELARERPPAFLRVVGCEPATVEPDPDGRLSEPVNRAADEAASIVASLVKEWEGREAAHA